MDDKNHADDEYEQQFIDKVRHDTASQREATVVHKSSHNPSGASKFLIILSIVLSLIVIIESVALVVLVFNESSDDDTTPVDYTPGNDDIDAYKYDENRDLVSFSLTCTLENGDGFYFTKDGNYKEYVGSTDPTHTGTYAIINSSVVSLKPTDDNTKNLFYDGLNVIDNLTFYECVEND